MQLPAQFDHDSFVTIAGVGVGYGIILVAIFLLLFVVPFVVFSLL